MKWKTALTAEEAALFATDLNRHVSLMSAKQSLTLAQSNAPCYKLGEIEDGLVDPEKEAAELSEYEHKVQMAQEIYDALIDEIVLADPYEQYSNVPSILDVAIRA